MNRPENLAVAAAWYRPEQWALLRAVSADVGELEMTHDEWLAVATQQVRALEAHGIQVQKVEIEVGALTRWCESEGRVVDAKARSEYAGRRLGRLL